MEKCEHCELPAFACLCGLQNYKEPVRIFSGDLAKVKVYIAHHQGEAEVSEESLRHHVRITGALPSVGEPLRCLPKGATHRLFSLPFGQVVRVEHSE